MDDQNEREFWEKLDAVHRGLALLAARGLAAAVEDMRGSESPPNWKELAAMFQMMEQLSRTRTRQPTSITVCWEADGLPKAAE